MANNFFKVGRGLSLIGQTSAPSNPVNGDIYYDTTLNLFQKYENGAWGSFGGSAGVSFTITAGENLSANVPFYISEGAADGSRTAGRAYKLDATNSKRYQFAGFTTASILSGATGTAQAGGLLAGFTGLTQNTTYYGNITTPGTTQVTPPTVIGQWVVPLGTAVSTTELLVNPAAADFAYQLTNRLGETINYLAANAQADTDVGGYATYADAAGTSPVDGTGGAANITFTRSTSSPLRGVASFLFTKDAANRQGQGASYDFTIDSTDQAKPLAIAFDYAIASGTFADGDLTVYLYDVTNAQIIQPGPFRLTAATVGLSQRFVSYFQTNVNSTSYRLIFHVASTSASAYTVKLDNLSLGPSYQPYGTVITDWQSYTPGTTQGFGTPTSQEIFYRRVGDSVEIQGRCITGTNTSTEGRIGLPPGLTSSTSKITTIRQAGTWTRGAATVMDGITLIESGVTYLTFGRQTSTEAGLTKRNGDNITGSGEAFSFWASVPIQGWSSNVQISTDADTRVVAARAALTNAFTGASAVIPFNSVQIDTHAGFNTSTGVYTVPVAGIYRVRASSVFSNLDGVTNENLSIRKNGSDVSQFYGSRLGDNSGASGFASALDLVQCVAGDTLSVFAQGDASFTLDNNGIRTVIAIDRISGPAQIAASETIACSYQTNASSAAVSSGTPDTLSFTTKIVDTHNAFSGSTYTVPASGIYEIMACIQMTTSSATAAPSAQIAVNGTSVAAVFQNGASTAGRNCCPMVQYMGRLTQGQTITVLGRDGVGLSTYVSGSNGTYIYIKRIGT